MSVSNMADTRVKLDENQELVDFPDKAKSKVWGYFGFIKERNNDGPPKVLQDKAIYKVCNGAYKYTGGTTNLAVHLAHSHRINVKEGGKATLKVAEQPTICAAFSSSQDTGIMGPLPQSKKALIDEMLREFIIKYVVPLSLVEGLGIIVGF